MRRRYPMPIYRDPVAQVRSVPVLCWYRELYSVATGLSSWTDKVGGKNLVQATPGKQAAVGVGSHGRAEFVFDGSDDEVTATGFSWKLLANEQYYARIVARRITHTTGRYMFSAGSGTVAFGLRATSVSPEIEQFASPGPSANANSRPPLNTWASYQTFFAPSGASFLTVQKKTVRGGNVGVGVVSSGLSVGSGSGGGFQFGNLAVSELTICLGAPNTEELDEWAGYEREYYSGVVQ